MSEGSSEQYHPKAFISHSTQDHEFVVKFATDLRANGVDAWYSGWEIKPGDSIRTKIEEGLEGCEYFIIVLSKQSANRPWVQTELDAATIRKLSGKVRKIIPVKIEECGDLPPTLASLCWEDFSNQPYEPALKRVLNSIFDVDIRPPLGQPPNKRAPETTPRAAVAMPEGRTVTRFPISALATDRFVHQLRSEGFDARTDVFNGQVGIIIGPTGLDPKRIPPDEIGIFFPLWELNHQTNRPLVEARHFHEIVETRPKDWQYNRPYPRNEDGLSESQRNTTDNRPTPSVFVSYVKEDFEVVSRIADVLRVFEVDVWLDKTALKPGLRWQDQIRHGIAHGDFFLACFSSAYLNRTKTYMNEELTVAIEELRLRPAGRAWFIPVKLDECEIPDRPIGAGETLRSIQWVDLHADWSMGMEKVLSVVVPGSERIPRLIERLKDKSARRRVETIETLGKLGPLAKSALPHLIELIDREVGDPLGTLPLAAIHSALWSLGYRGDALRRIENDFRARGLDPNTQFAYAC